MKKEDFEPIRSKLNTSSKPSLKSDLEKIISLDPIERKEDLSVYKITNISNPTVIQVKEESPKFLFSDMNHWKNMSYISPLKEEVADKETKENNTVQPLNQIKENAIERYYNRLKLKEKNLKKCHLNLQHEANSNSNTKQLDTSFEPNASNKRGHSDISESISNNSSSIVRSSKSLSQTSDTSDSEISSLASDIKNCKDGKYVPVMCEPYLEGRVDSMILSRTQNMLANVRARRRTINNFRKNKDSAEKIENCNEKIESNRNHKPAKESAVKSKRPDNTSSTPIDNIEINENTNMNNNATEINKSLVISPIQIDSMYPESCGCWKIMSTRRLPVANDMYNPSATSPGEPQTVSLQKRYPNLVNRNPSGEARKEKSVTK